MKKPHTYANPKSVGATPARTYVNTATTQHYAGPIMACTRPQAGLKSLNGRVA